MKKMYVMLFLLLLCTASVFSSQLYSKAIVSEQIKTVMPSQRDSTSIISGIIALPSFK